MQSHGDDAKYLENAHYRDLEGWAPGSSLESGSVSSFGPFGQADAGSGMERGQDGNVGSIGSLPAYADREIVYNLKINPSTHKVAERSPARYHSYCCTIPGCNKAFTQSWHLWNHQYQQHGNSIRGSDFALTRRIKIHPHQLLDRENDEEKKKKNKKKKEEEKKEEEGSPSNSKKNATVKDKKNASNAIYAKKHVSASASVVPGGLPPMQLIITLGYYEKTHKSTWAAMQTL